MTGKNEKVLKVLSAAALLADLAQTILFITIFTKLNTAMTDAVIGKGYMPVLVILCLSEIAVVLDAACSAQILGRKQLMQGCRFAAALAVPVVILDIAGLLWVLILGAYNSMLIPGILSAVIVLSRFILILIAGRRELEFRRYLRKTLLGGILAAAVSCLIVAVPVAAARTAADHKAATEWPLKMARCLGDFQAETLDGENITAEDLKGHKVVIVNLWTTWCKNCKREMPDMGKLYEEYKDQGVLFVGICADTVEDGEVSEEIVQEGRELCADLGATYPSIVPSDENLQELVNMLSDTGYPYTIIMNENGEVIETFSAAREEQEWREIIEKYL